MKKLWLGVIILALCFMMGVKGTRAQEEKIMTGKITKINEEKMMEVMGKEQLYQQLEVTVINGDDKGQKLTIINGDIPVVNPVEYEINDKVMISQKIDPNGKAVYVIEDVVRGDSLILLFLIFLVIALSVSGWRGLSSVASMGISFLVIFKFILPQISNGANPVLIAVIGSLVIIPVIFFMSHGFNAKTLIAISGTVTALLVTGLLSSLFIKLTHLYGYSSEESGFLAEMKNAIDMRGILLAGIVIGAMGVLDDVAVSQAAIVEQLKEASEKIKFRELYARAIKVGQDHIASMINTLVLVYAGASLPLLLIFIDNPEPFGQIVNYEFVAEEIVRTLVGSIGLMTAVPITTLIAAMWFGKRKNNFIDRRSSVVEKQKAEIK